MTELLVLDFDGVFYQFNDAFMEDCHDAAARSALRLGVRTSFDAARQTAIESVRIHRSSIMGFVEHHHSSIEDWHRAWDIEMPHRHAHPCTIMPEQLQACKTPVAVLSHSSRRWIRELLQRFNLHHLIPDNHIFSIEDIDYRFKHLNSDAFNHVLQSLGVKPESATMVEDTVANLRHAKSIGMRTVLVADNPELAKDEMNYVDHIVDNLGVVLEGGHL